MINFQKVYSLLQENYFITAYIFILEITAAILALRNFKKQYLVRLFVLFLLCDALFLFCDILFLSTPSLPKQFKFKFITVTNTIIGFIELVAYYSYFKKLLDNHIITKSINIIQSIMFILTLLMISLIIIKPLYTMEYFANVLGGLELVLLIPPCIFYFRKLLNTESDRKLFSRPSFWISGGLFFYSASVIPYYLIKQYLNTIHHPLRSDIATAFFYTPIIINIIFLIFAFRWKRDIMI